MNRTLRVSALALALAAGTAFAAAPAMAGGDYHHRWDRKSWNNKHYKHKKHRKRYSRRWDRGHGYDRRYYGPYWYGPRRPAYGWNYGAPGFYLRIY